jgi:riboflavin kinase/FMN adenylyltransferase
MEILPGLEALPDPRLGTPVTTWGVFDGVHRGHRRVLETLRDWARDVSAPAVAVTFDRHPSEVLTGRPVPLLVSLEERLRRIAETGVDFVLVIAFTPEFARLRAEDFVRDVVVGRLRARGIVLGHDSRFGRAREGDLDLLARLGEQMGIEVRRCEPELHGGRPISSSLIREAIAAGRLEEAALLLGRPPSVTGTVARGDRRGSGLGFPTANVPLGRSSVRPPAGVYAVEVPLEGQVYRGVANLGVRPTFESAGPEILEVHLLDYPGGDLYGRTLEIRFLSRLREERRFESVEALRRQIQADIESVRGR